MSTIYHSYYVKSIEKDYLVRYAIGSMQFETMQQVKKYLDQFIQPPGGLGSGKHNFGRMVELMKHLRDPQNELKIIHVAGTSGKGSTSYAISSLLRAHGFDVGLTVSPHMLDLRERTQINNQMVSVKDYCQNVSEIVPAIEAMKQSKYGSPSFFEITMAHAFYTFAKEKVDYAVIETGLGGRYDASNVVTRADKLAVITRIGLDHMDFLGDTIAKIAEEKAHIIQKGNRVLSVPQEYEVEQVIERVAGKKHASLKFIEVRQSIQSSLHGAYQKENLSLALSAVYELSKSDSFSYDNQKVKQTLQNLQFIGRFDVREINGKKVILDGAHNPQKMNAFLASLTQEFPDQKFDVLLAFSQTKDFIPMLESIVPLASTISITTFGNEKQGMHVQSQRPEHIKDALLNMGFTNSSTIAHNKNALQTVLEKSTLPVVITGSLYLLSDVYSYISNTQ